MTLTTPTEHPSDPSDPTNPPGHPDDATGATGASRSPWWFGALDGIVAGLLTVGVGTLLASVLVAMGLAGGQPAPVAAVSEAFIDRTPPWLKDFAISTFGTNDKRALLVGTVIVLTLLCAAIGVLTRRRMPVGLLAYAVVGAVGGAAVLSRPGSAPLDVLPVLVGTVLGLWFLRRSALGGLVAPDHLRGDTADDPGRRWLLGGGVGLLAAWAGGFIGGGSSAATASREAVAAAPATTAGSLVVPAGADLRIPGAVPFIVPNDDFYRIDTAIVVPRVDAATWKLKVTGMVEREVEIDWATLQGKEQQEAMITLMCVSNEVGGDLTGNAVWTGWPVRELLAMAGPKAGADMVLQTSVDGWTCGTPLTTLTDDRNALLATRMNGEPLPFEHGFPVRVVVPGLYGYVSATKWVTELKVTTFDADQGYWTPRGWAPLGPVKTESRVDVPKAGASVPAGKVAVAGVAWAQHRGISKVEVQVDDGPWTQARLAVDATVDAWRQWVYEWDATSGSHDLRVRAYDTTGEVQTPYDAPPAPDGATGIHTVTVRVD
ncbi:DMSO/TMAO reductase YedYZ molybdopterin-dependent catalytic subunit [Terracoccus luteus]|uniref:DMSO/TMAO reductase YedYZ molybdopterin-dependent catalytic subunit n=1 Tax=Terracoccus luteus TaxID=53356 RepID=A0A495XQZ9_9MICO|nr:molybdopterin-dependent oxidoreductase [Terracoccus luteus]RKT77001.1 DMSO/TMAO reductase YedYZ molybdopterin-dependent catalytic subunit [Terracoccus luteus]